MNKKKSIILFQVSHRQGLVCRSVLSFEREERKEEEGRGDKGKRKERGGGGC